MVAASSNQHQQQAIHCALKLHIYFFAIQNGSLSSVNKSRVDAIHVEHYVVGFNNPPSFLSTLSTRRPEEYGDSTKGRSSKNRGLSAQKDIQVEAKVSFVRFVIGGVYPGTTKGCP